MAHVKDIDHDQFAQEVIQRSHEVPVVVDFWATWCGPCRVLGPALERVAEGYGGRFQLVKVDIDANRALAEQFRIQSVPTVIGFRDGIPVASFTGSIPEPRIRTWIDQLLPSELDLMVDRARDLALDGADTEAEAVYRQVLDIQADHPEAATGLAALLIARGESAEALIVLGKLPRSPEVERLEATARVVAVGGADITDLRRRLDADAEDDAVRIELGRALAARGEYEPGLDNLLEAVRRGGPRREEARQAMVDVFGLIGPTHPIAAVYRRLLANELF